MPLQIFNINNLPVEDWNILTGNSIYSSTQFIEIFKNLNGRELFICDICEGKLMAGIAGVMFGGRFLRRFQSLPDSLIGGFYFDPQYSDDEKEKFVNDFALWLKSMSVIRADINCSSIVLNSRYFLQRKLGTHIISIKDLNYEIRDKKLKEHIRAGIRRETQISEFKDSTQFESFICLTEKTYARHKVAAKYNSDFFKKLYELSLTDNRILWLKAENEGKLIGSRICFIDKGGIRLWQYYSDAEYNRCKPGFLLIDYIISYAKQNSLDEINMGASPGEPENLEKYKERWGGVKTDINYYTYFGGLGKLIYKWK